MPILLEELMTVNGDSQSPLKTVPANKLFMSQGMATHHVHIGSNWIQWATNNNKKEDMEL